MGRRLEAIEYLTDMLAKDQLTFLSVKNYMVEDRINLCQQMGWLRINMRNIVQLNGFTSLQTNKTENIWQKDRPRAIRTAQS